MPSATAAIAGMALMPAFFMTGMPAFFMAGMPVFFMTGMLVFPMAGMPVTVMMLMVSATLAGIAQTSRKVIVHDIHHRTDATANHRKTILIQLVERSGAHVSRKHDGYAFLFENGGHARLATAALRGRHVLDADNFTGIVHTYD